MATKQKVKASNQETLVNFILDKSGSMESVKAATISGFNEYIQTLKKDGNKYSFTLTLFDTQITTPVKDENLKDVEPLNAKSYDPNGSTALYDAVCTTIKGVSEKKGQKVITIIMTDGEENSSKEFSEREMKSLIAEREKKGNWTFVFLGANQDSYAAAQKFGIPTGNAVNFVATSAGMSRAMNTLANNTTAFSMSASASTSAFFAKTDQDNLMSTNTSGASNVDPAVSAHFSSLGKKSWESRKNKLL